MLWYKSWLETRWRFLIGLGMLICSAATVVLTYPQVIKLLPMVPTNLSGPIGERIREAAELSRSYRGYVWSHWFNQNLSQWSTLFAILLGTAALLVQSGGDLFTLSLPVSRARLLGVRAATGLAELFVIALIPSLLIPIVSPAIGESFGVGSALLYGVCVFVATSVFFSIALLLSTIFSDAWRPLLISLAVAIGLGLIDQILHNPSFSLYGVMSGASYFRSGHVPWLGLLGSAAASMAFCYAAVVNIQRRDF
jgi:ABC-2 type transport system permease protein